jgi:hypothetical protein
MPEINFRKQRAKVAQLSHSLFLSLFSLSLSKETQRKNWVLRFLSFERCGLSKKING